MLKLTVCLASLFILFSCNTSEKDPVKDNQLTTKAYEAEITSLDQSISKYADISQTGAHYLQLNNWVDSMIDGFKNQVIKGDRISPEDRSAFFEHLEKDRQKDDPGNMDVLKILPMNTISDLNTLKLYIKNDFVCTLLINRIVPYNSWSTMASTKNWEIKNGEEFEVFLSNTMWNSASPGEWFLLKDGGEPLTKDNILDTLHQDESGIVTYKTKHYEKGENVLVFASKQPDRKEGHNTLYRSVIFTVR